MLEARVEHSSFEGIVGKSRAMRDLFQLLETVAATASTILITGDECPTDGVVDGFDADTVYLSPAPLYHAAPLRFCMAIHQLGVDAER